MSVVIRHQVVLGLYTRARQNHRNLIVLTSGWGRGSTFSNDSITPFPRLLHAFSLTGCFSASTGRVAAGVNGWLALPPVHEDTRLPLASALNCLLRAREARWQVAVV